MSTLGYNTGYIEELHRLYLEDPANVGESWQEFFADYDPGETRVAPVVADTPSSVASKAPTPVETPAPISDAEEKVLRGAAARLAENMEGSLLIPTATSVRDVPVKLMAENRRLINEYQRHVGGEKVSFTHLIAYAIILALKEQPNVNTTFRRVDENGIHVIPSHVNLGLAIDVEKRGKRSLLVPNIKQAETLSFNGLIGAYNDIVRRARESKLEIADFKGTTATLTNPGMIGTSLSVPRLMEGQGVIVGVGAIGYPTSYYAVPPDAMSRAGISQSMTITSTYDHRVIQGAESGAFLAVVEQLLRGEHGFYDDVFSSLGIPYRPFTPSTDSTPQLGGGSELEMIQKQARVLQLIRAYRVRGHLQADVNPLGYEWTYHSELDPATYGLTIWDLDREFVTDGLAGAEMLALRDILNILRRTYTRKIGVEFMHISDPTEKAWIQARIEAPEDDRALTDAEKRRMLEKLNAAEAFENVPAHEVYRSQALLTRRVRNPDPSP